MAFGPGRLASALDQLDASWRDGRLCVALSGGMDSLALLHALCALRDSGAGPTLRAVHVDHGLQACAPEWAAHCRSVCERLGVPLAVVALGPIACAGESLEAAAREARYAAFARLLQDGEWLLTAHHRDDQLETVLIQLLRGAGVAGLAAMPDSAPLGRGRHGRPLLGLDRAEIADYATRHDLPWQRDPMNESARFDRGWLRAEILPQLRARWPAAAATVARSARHLAGAARLLAELAEADARAVADGERLVIEGLLRLSRERQANLLRWWLRGRGLPPPPAARLAAALDQLVPARGDAQPVVRWRAGELRRYRGRLYAMMPLAEAPPASIAIQAGGAGVGLGEGCGRFRLLCGTEGGLRADLPPPLELRFRNGGESLQPAPARPRKRLKDLCQEAGVVPWMRARLPLVHAGGRLVAVGDLWIDAAFRAPPGTPSLRPLWEGRPPIF